MAAYSPLMHVKPTTESVRAQMTTRAVLATPAAIDAFRSTRSPAWVREGLEKRGIRMGSLDHSGNPEIYVAWHSQWLSGERLYGAPVNQQSSRTTNDGSLRMEYKFTKDAVRKLFKASR
ncbi:MAG: hypothetical protein KatS3mg082_1389 [Nitrospiraceae bacterium]|nr:MAG: hypothetical protein KatS3mg082_1389 [Nitrospiraceae bacterium]